MSLSPVLRCRLRGTVQGAAADLDGGYRILNVRPGTYTLEFRFIGYQTQVVENVQVRTDLNTEVNVRLSPETFVGEEVVIQATQDVVIRDLTSSESRVSRDQIERMPVQEVGDIIQLQAGVTVGPGGAIHIRGGRASEVAYIVDGVRVTDDYDRGSGLRIENQAIEELQVVSGTFNAEYGQAMSGIVNIATRSGTNDWRGSLNIWGGDYATQGGTLYMGAPGSVSEVNPMHQYNIEGSLSGPIIRDKLTLFVSGRRVYEYRMAFWQECLLTPGSTLPGRSARWLQNLGAWCDADSGQQHAQQVWSRDRFQQTLVHRS